MCAVLSLSTDGMDWGDLTMLGEYKGKRVVVCFTTEPVSTEEFSLCGNHLFGWNDTLNQGIVIGYNVGLSNVKRVHVKDDYTHTLIWFKYLDDHRGLMGMDYDAFMESFVKDSLFMSEVNENER